MFFWPGKQDNLMLFIYILFMSPCVHVLFTIDSTLTVLIAGKYTIEYNT